MTMTQSYYAGGSGLDAFHHQSYRAPMSHQGSYYDREAVRAGPYGYYDARRELRPERYEHRQEYHGRLPTHALIQEHEQHEVVGGQARRRIAVACARCRRRKIKCSGDPHDGTGCQACKQSGANVRDCAFMRVNSNVLAFKDSNGVNMLPVATDADLTAVPATYTLDTSSVSTSYPTTYNTVQHRPSLPTLHTRTTYSHHDYDNQYDHSPADSYTYSSSSLPRQDSFASVYSSQDASRSYSIAPLSAPAAAPSYDLQAGYMFSNVYSPVASRLPSVTGDGSSSLNMGSLHSSLPLSAVAERRLPVPYTTTYSQPQQLSTGTTHYPSMRSFDSAGFRPHVNGIHSRTAMGWVSDIDAPSTPAVYLQRYSAAPTTHGMRMPSHTMPQQSGSQSACSTSTADAGPAFGYQFHQTPSYADAMSPSSGASMNGTYMTTTAPSSASTLSMLPPATTQSIRYTASNPSLPQLPAPEDQYASSTRRSSSSRHQEAAASLSSLYSFSSEAPQEQRSSSIVSPDSQQMSVRAAQQSPADAAYTNNARHSQPQHVASHESLRRGQSSSGQSSGRGRMQRSSLHSLGEGYE
ncbi:hypothetical protein B0A48_03451 [Cryoendolithus antarcticus]|uniref:Zn(2)-C6 fungal-type domain-containing protein n=1 Tax=Cryoendolithus antarcticus TaxID=1507870 RepID=A0A1V8TK94_9PEZI|nr:hypothetical protein B0A48_03451 [Cryoendolithus antarcticus]